MIMCTVHYGSSVDMLYLLLVVYMHILFGGGIMYVFSISIIIVLLALQYSVQRR